MNDAMEFTAVAEARKGGGIAISLPFDPASAWAIATATTDDLADALRSDAGARGVFESLATFYRNGFVTWVESPKRPETRAKRIAATLAALQARRREP